MRIVCYHRTGDPALSALAEGARGLGHDVTITPAKYWKPGEVVADADLVVVVGLHGSARQLRDVYEGRGVPVWVMDLPRLRASGAAAGFTRGGLHWLPAQGVAKGPPTPGVLTDRTPDRVLVVGQYPLDAAHGLDMAELQGWARHAMADVRRATALPVAYRPHPLAATGETCGADALDTAPTIRDALRTAACVVTYNSTVGWDAIDAGVPVVACAPRELVGYADYCTLGIPAVLPPPALSAAKRREALRRVAATCWTQAQLASGEAITALLAADAAAVGVAA